MKDRFMKEDDNTFQKQLGWNILGALTAIAGGPLWGYLFRGPGAEKVAESLALGIVATGKDKDTANVEDELSKAANLEIALNVTMTGWEKMVTGYARKVFAGTAEGNGLLSDFMANGALIPGGVPKGMKSPRLMGVDEMKDLAKHALFMYIIPEAWRHNKDANVAILETGRACGDFSEYKDEVIFTTTAKKVELCFEDKQYLMLGAIGPQQRCINNPGSSFPYCENLPFSEPPGLDNLQEFGLTYQDIMTASLRTWTKNSKQNGYQFNPDSLEFRNFFDDSDTDKVLDLGMVRIPVCSPAQARRNWGDPEPKDKGEFYPC
ncbi:hypothetical protein N657DRAFT_170457 [Parathielavia appendiculata]|uniref:Uncharacterized protein n=1 Tax=Parathielavia appendiculata TaxID=2587402 RepID=A0AAN6TSZ4_9PEZI|nr:hypothetical protein N657DRAFT_170457 [Parathielavia appendiculata]